MKFRKLDTLRNKDILQLRSYLLIVDCCVDLNTLLQFYLSMCVDFSSLSAKNILFGFTPSEAAARRMFFSTLKVKKARGKEGRKALVRVLRSHLYSYFLQEQIKSQSLLLFIIFSLITFSFSSKINNHIGIYNIKDWY